MNFKSMFFEGSVKILWTDGLMLEAWKQLYTCIFFRFDSECLFHQDPVLKYSSRHLQLPNGSAAKRSYSSVFSYDTDVNLVEVIRVM